MDITKVSNIIQIVFIAISVACNVVLAWLSFAQAKSAERTTQKIYASMDVNKEKQKPDEEVLKDMAKTKCDKCGKEIEVRAVVQHDGINGKNYDLCTDCAAQMRTLDIRLKALDEQYKTAQAKADELKAQMDDLISKGA